MVRIKRALSLLLITILIAMNATVAYATEPEDTDVVASEASAGAGSSIEEKAEKKKDDEPVTESISMSASDGASVQANAASTSDTSDSGNAASTGDTSDSSAAASTGDSALDDIVTIDQELLLQSQGGQDQNLVLPSFARKGMGYSAPVQMPYNADFYIREGRVGADIPSEPQNYSYTEYSAAIYVENALLPNKLELIGQGAFDGNQSNLRDDGFTANNDVSNALFNVPSAEQIKAVVSSFDPEKHYVVWYAVKNPSGMIHVDGVIRQKEIIEEVPEVEYTTGDPERDAYLDKIEAGITVVNIMPLYLDNEGRSLDEIEYDGQEHIVGGFEIIVVDKSRNPLAAFWYNLKGELFDQVVYADDGDGTLFTYLGETFFVNITSHRSTVVDFLPDPSFYCGDKLVPYNQIKVTDARGKELNSNIVPAPSEVQGPGSSPKISLKKRDIELTAGTTVKNYDGSTIINDKFEITGGSLVEGHRIKSVTIVGSQTAIGHSPNQITGYEIVDEKGRSVNYYYNVTTVDGTLWAVDGSKNKDSEDNSDRYTSTGDGNNANGRYIPNTATTAKKSTTEIINGRVARAKITHADGSVTYINVPFETSYGNDLSDNQPQVLGARRGATDDPTSDMNIRVLIILLLMGVVIWSLQKNNNSSAIG